MARAQSHLEEVGERGRMEACTELFEGADPILTVEELRLLDALHSALERQGDDGVWGTDEYEIHTAGTASDSATGVVCVSHPQITRDSVLRGGDGRDDETEERLNAALWSYSERVATLVGEEFDAFLAGTRS